MRDPLELLAQQAAVVLDLEPDLARGGAGTWEEVLRWTTRDELNELIEVFERLRAEGRDVPPSEAMSVVPVAVGRRVQLRRALGLGTEVDDHLGPGLSVRLRECVVPWPKTVSGCRCGEDAIDEAAAEVDVIDRRVVEGVRARAGVLHARLVRRLEEARARRPAEVSRFAQTAVGGREGRSTVGLRDIGLGTIGQPLVRTAEAPSESVPVAVRAVSPVRVSAVARDRLDGPRDLDELSLRLTGRRAEKAPPRGVVS